MTNCVKIYIYIIYIYKYICFHIGEGNGNSLQYSCLENSMDKEIWQATVHGVTKSRTRLSDFHTHTHTHTHTHFHIHRIRLSRRIYKTTVAVVASGEEKAGR